MGTADNKTLAARARELADQYPGGSLERRGAATAAVALGSTRTIKAARDVLTEHLDGDVLAEAHRLIDRITKQQNGDV